MFTFTLSALAGAVIGGSYVLVRTPRTGKENQLFVKNFIQTTQDNIQDVSDQALDVQQAISNLTAEVQNIQSDFIPEIIDIADDFKNEAAVSTRRINDDLSEINREIDSMDFPSQE